MPVRGAVQPDGTAVPVQHSTRFLRGMGKPQRVVQRMQVPPRSSIIPPR